MEEKTNFQGLEFTFSEVSSNQQRTEEHKNEAEIENRKSAKTYSASNSPEKLK